MAKLTLDTSLPLDGLNTQIGDTRLMAVENLDILSIALPCIVKDNAAIDARAALESRVQAAFGLSLPDVGFVSGTDDAQTLLGLQPGMWFLTTTEQTPAPVRTLKTALEETAYLTDQSDSWAVLDIAGPRTQAALERICQLDIDDTVFDGKRVARTSMEHLSVIMQRPERNRFRLYSPTSSAQSFLHAVTVSLQNVT